MAKNAIETKKRIAHNKDSILEVEGALPSCLDYVSSIIQDMDNFTAGHSNNLKVQTSKSGVKSTQHNNVEKNILPPSDNQGHSQNINILKSKKFGIARKFPLMEKSQKTLKQIRHNRKQPKPRAHLASIDIPLKKDPIDNCRVSTLKTNKPYQKAVNLRTESLNKISDKPEHEKIIPQLRPGPSKKLNEASKKTPGKEADSCKVKNNSNLSKKADACNVKNNSNLSKKADLCNVKNNSNLSKKADLCNVENNSNLSPVPTKVQDDSVPCDSSNSDTTDSEYEQFVKKAKKGLQKTCKKQKASSNKRNASKKAPRRAVKNSGRKIATKLLSSDDDSHFSEENSSDQFHTKSKRIKIASKEKSPIPADSDSEFEADNSKRIEGASKEKSIPVASDCQFEADNLRPQNTPISQSSVQFDLMEDSTLYTSCYRRSTRNKSYVIAENEKSCASVECNGESETDNFDGESYSRVSSPGTDVVDVVAMTNSKADPQIITQDSNSNLNSELHYLPNKNNEPSNPVFPNIPYSDLCSTIKTNVKEEQIQSPDVVVIDSDSDTESPISMPKIEEKSAVNKDESQVQSEESDIEIVDVVINQENYKNKVNIKVEKNSSSSVESQKLPSSLIKVEQEVPEKNNVNDHCSATYRTDICTTQNEVVDQSRFDKKTLNPNTNQPTTSKNMFVKIEDDDDDVVILDSQESLTGKNTAILENINHPVSAEIPPDINTILELYKNEFRTYKEILQTEATIGATFKLLESRQAERLMTIKEKYLKPISQTYKGKMKSNAEHVTNIKKEMNPFIGGVQISSLKTLTHKLEESSQKLMDFETSHSVEASAANTSSPTFIQASDIKPNIFQLQAILKTVQEQKPSSASSSETSTSFGEKCIVCGKEAVAACQQCAKVFFCSDDCGKKYWINGHETKCGK